MRKGMVTQLLFISLICFSVAKVYAVSPGFYLGFMTGPATNSAKTTNAVVSPGTQDPLQFTPVDPKETQWGTAVYLGYKINEYVGPELGVNFFTNVSFTSKNDVKTAGGTSAHVRDLYLVIRGSVPVGSAFEVFGKIGPAFEYISTSGGLNQPIVQCKLEPALPGQTNAQRPCSSQNVTRFQTKYQSKISTFIGIGASWAMSQNWVADISVNSLPVGNVIKNVTWVAFGVSYHFVDTYCGQFLC